MSGTLYYEVVQGLECCILCDPDDHQRCGACPYNPHAISNEPCANGLKADALSLIRELRERIADLEALLVRPRLLDLSELRALPLGAVVWREDRWPDEDGGLLTAVTPVMRSLCCGAPVLADGESQTEIFAIRLEADADGSQERYWSARPTEEQREASPWA